ncbi:hypothetical protein HOG21_06330 [bacterium]|jgi:hypothetical protein|nr:hypothetical protein [bacterium]
MDIKIVQISIGISKKLFLLRLVDLIRSLLISTVAIKAKKPHIEFIKNACVAHEKT